MRGGPFHRLVLSRLSLRQRMALPVVIAWLPLFILSVARGVGPLFLRDVGTHVRFLFVAPLILGMERILDARVRRVVAQFTRSGLVDEKSRAGFDAILKTAGELRDSILAEGVMLFLAYASGHIATPWRALRIHDTRETDAVGLWFTLISLPFLQFLILRLAWRFALWSMLLVKTARLPLEVSGLHPDRAGGLRFIHVAHAPFSVLSFALSAIVSASVWQVHAIQGTPVDQFFSTIVAFAVVATLLTLAPLLAFTPKLTRARNRAHLEYGGLGDAYARAFREKWFSESAANEESILGSSDVQSLADFQTSLEGVHTMQTVLIDRYSILGVVVPIVLPLIPLFLTYVPAMSLLKAAFSLIA